MLIASLAGGDRRSIGAVHSVVAQTLRDPSLVQDLVAALRSPDPVVPMRAADALEKISRHHSDWLIKYRARLLQAAADAPSHDGSRSGFSTTTVPSFVRARSTRSSTRKLKASMAKRGS